MYGPGDWDLYEVCGDEVYYKGVAEDTLEDHLRKCGPCYRANKTMPGCMVPHGQIMKSPYDIS